MITISFEFDHYPIGKQCYTGTAEVEITEAIQARHSRTEAILIPLQRPLKRRLKSAKLVGVRKNLYSRDDLERYVMGRYWLVIDPLAYEQVALMNDMPDWAQYYHKISQVALEKLRENRW